MNKMTESKTTSAAPMTSAVAVKAISINDGSADEEMPHNIHDDNTNNTKSTNASDHSGEKSSKSTQKMLLSNQEIPTKNQRIIKFIIAGIVFLAILAGVKYGILNKQQQQQQQRQQQQQQASTQNYNYDSEDVNHNDDRAENHDDAANITKLPDCEEGIDPITISMLHNSHSPTIAPTIIISLASNNNKHNNHNINNDNNNNSDSAIITSSTNDNNDIYDVYDHPEDDEAQEENDNIRRRMNNVRMRKPSSSSSQSSSSSRKIMKCNDQLISHVPGKGGKE